MILVLLRFVYHAVVNLNWSWNASCKEAGAIFNIKPYTVHKLGKLHRDINNNLLPPELPRKTCGRGSDTFKANDVEGRFKKLKEHHLAESLNYVRERNRSMSGICTVLSVQSHLFHEYNIMFKRLGSGRRVRVREEGQG